MRLAAFLVAMSIGTGAFAQSDLPRRKSGLWLVDVASQQLGEIKWHECVDRDQDEFLAKPRDRSCSKPAVRRQGAGYVQEMECKRGNSTETIRSLFSGNFESSYRIEGKVSYRPPVDGVSEDTMKGRAQWLGPCKPGQKHGYTMMLDDDDEDEKKPPAKKKR